MKINVVFLLESMLLLASFWGVWQVQFLDGLASVSRQTSIHALALLCLCIAVCDCAVTWTGELPSVRETRWVSHQLPTPAARSQIFSMESFTKQL